MFVCAARVNIVNRIYHNVAVAKALSNFPKYGALNQNKTVGNGNLKYQPSVCHYTTDNYNLDQLRADIDTSFTVEDSDGQLTHGIGIGKKGKSLVFPFLNPDKKLQSSDTEKSADGDDGKTTKSGKKTKVKVPSVTTILDKTKPFSSRVALKKWEAKLIRELGKEGFLKFRQEMLSKGKAHHKNIEGFLAGIPESEIPVTPNLAGFWKSVRHVLADCKQIECERRVTHPALDYCGIVDCVGTYRDQLCVIEWKTSQKPKPTLKQCYEIPLQAVAYAGALNYDSTFKLETSISQALLVIAYADGSPAHAHQMSSTDCEIYWSQWLAKILEYRAIMKKQQN